MGAAVGLAVSALLVPTAAADSGSSGRTRIQAQDRCDPATFNAVLGPGACVGDGNVTFEELGATVNPQDFGHDAWRFTREETHINRGDTLRVSNAGGEDHTFTEVVEFGPGGVPPLNGVFPPGTETADFVVARFDNFMPAGASVTVPDLPVGTHKFQCWIHPWMQSTVTVRP